MTGQQAIAISHELRAAVAHVHTAVAHLNALSAHRDVINHLSRSADNLETAAQLFDLQATEGAA